MAPAARASGEFRGSRICRNAAVFSSVENVDFQQDRSVADAAGMRGIRAGRQRDRSGGILGTGSEGKRSSPRGRSLDHHLGRSVHAPIIVRQDDLSVVIQLQPGVGERISDSELEETTIRRRR